MRVRDLFPKCFSHTRQCSPLCKYLCQAGTPHSWVTIVNFTREWPVLAGEGPGLGGGGGVRPPGDE